MRKCLGIAGLLFGSVLWSQTSINVTAGGVSAPGGITMFVPATADGSTPISFNNPIQAPYFVTNINGPIQANISLGQRLRTHAAAVSVSNALINTPWIAPYAWQSGTSYKDQSFVTNSGNIYFCRGTGTSSVAPTGQANAGVADGTLTWYYFSPANLTSDPNAPTISGLNGLPPSPYTKYYGPLTPNALKFIGGNLVPNFERVSGQYTIGNNYLTSTHSSGMEFITDAPVFYIYLGGNGETTSVIIDSRYLTLSPFPNTYSNFLKIDFSGFARKPRKVRAISASLFFGNVPTDAHIVVTPLDSVWPPGADAIRAIFVTDSYGQSGMTTREFENQVSARLGWDDAWSSTFGGTGYINTNSGAGGTNYIGRLTDVTANNPDIVLVTGGLNDLGQPAVTLQAAVYNYLQAVRSGCPNAAILVFGVANPPAVNATAAENAVHAAVTQMNDSAVFFVPWTTDTAGAWQFGTGNVANLKNDGNNDAYISSDNTHPTQLGVDYLSARMDRSIRAILPRIP